jgi:hypothetical protein
MHAALPLLGKRMTESIEERSLRKETGAIRRLDAAQAREIVARFLRPVVGSDGDFAVDEADSIASAASGWVSLARPADDRGSAAVVGCYKTHLYLDGLERLSGRVATHLARHGGKLHLHGLARLGDGAAEAFGRRAGFLCLQKLKHLTPHQAQHLAQHRGPLHLASLKVDDDVAACLGRHEGSLSIRLSDAIPLERLAALVQHRGTIEIAGLERLDARRAAVLAARPCYRGSAGLSGLFLSDVRELSPGVAAILATHQAGELALSGIRSLSEAVARELVQHPILALDRVTSLTDQVAAILAAYAGASLSLRGLEHVSPSGLAKLRANVAIVLPQRLRNPPTPG